jgi:hypothetical protein
MLTDYPEAAQPLADLEPRHEFFIGIDSDGCASDTMEIQHEECFTPNIIEHWFLQPVSKYAREAAVGTCQSDRILMIGDGPIPGRQVRLDPRGGIDHRVRPIVAGQSSLEGQTESVVRSWR